MSTPNQSSILNRGLNVYTLPPALLSSLTVRSIQAVATEQSDNPSKSASTPSISTQPTPNVASTSLSCQTCPQATFETVEDQRIHFKSDWHRYNVKAKLRGKPATNLEEWEGLVEGVSSISGSASSSSGSEDRPAINGNGVNKVAKLFSKTLGSYGKGSGSSDEEAEIADRQRRAHLRTAVIWFSPSSEIPEIGIPKDTQFGVYRALFPQFQSASDYLGELKKMQLAPEVEAEGEERRFTLLAVAGGHFTGLVIGLRNKGKNEKQDVKGAGDVRVIRHKAFHRYTTRKKQGGSQAINDNAKSKAVSTGAMLRRYGEQALQDEIRELMTEWEEDIQGSERIFIRASTHGKKSFWGYDGAVIDKADERIRVFPFPTRRPTITELLRCWHELMRVKVSHLSSEALQALDDAYIASLQPKRTIPKPVQQTLAPSVTPAVPRLTPEEEAKQDRRRRLDDMIRKGRLEPLKPFWEKWRQEFETDDSENVLGLAASSGQEEVTKWFLEDIRLNPTLPIDSNGRRAYEVASTRAVRNIFRRCAYDHPDWWAWHTDARVPSGLSEEQEAEQDKKKVERRKGLKDKLKEREKEREKARSEVGDGVDSQNGSDLSGEPAVVFGSSGRAPVGGPQKLGGRIGGAENGLAGLSPEMRAKIERERRARAAEARLK